MRKNLLIGLVCLCVGLAIWKFYPKSSVSSIDQNDIVSVSTGSIENRIDVVAKVALVNKETLYFKQSGKIASVSILEGAPVKQWQVLASLDTKQITLDIASQKIALSNAKIALERLYESYGVTQKLQSNNTAQEAKRKEQNLQIDIEALEREKSQTISTQEAQIIEARKTVSVIEQKIASMKMDVEYAKRMETESIAETQATGDSRIRTTASNAQSLVNDMKDAGAFYKKLLSIENPNDSGYLQLGTAQLRSDASFKYADFITSQKKLEDAVQSFDASTATVNQAQSLANFTSDTAKMAASFNTTIKDVLDATVVGAVYTDATLSSYRSSVTSYLSKFTGWSTSANANLRDLVSGSSVGTIQLSTQSTLAAKQASLASTELDALKQKNTLDQLLLERKNTELDFLAKIQAKQLEIESARAAQNLTQKQYEDMLAGPKATEIALKKNDIAQAENSLVVLQEKIKEYQLIAPMDGIATAISIRTGKSSSATEGITVENRDMIQLKSVVDQSQVVKIQAGTKVKVTFDAYRQKSFDAGVSFVESVPTETSGVVSYTVKFVMKKPEGVELYDSMTASARILVDTVQDVLVIPLAAVQEDKSGKFVQVYQKGELTRKSIVIGKNDGLRAEVKEGLELGQKIAVKSYAATSAASSSFSLPWMGGGQRRTGGSSSSSPTGGAPLPAN